MDPSVFYLKTVLYLFVPLFCLIVPLFFFLPYGAYLIFAKQVDQDRSNFRNFVRAETNVLTKYYGKFEGVPRWKRVWLVVRDNYITSVIVTLFFVHPSITQQTFLMLSCKKIGIKDADFYLVPDLSRQCWTGEHYKWLWGLAFPMFLLYVVGIPLVAAFLLYRHRNNLSDQTIKYKYYFLYTGYEDKWFFWELVVIVRKILLVLISVFFVYNLHIQTLMALLLVVVSILMHVYAQPFSDDLVDLLEFVSLLTTLMTFYCGQYLFITDSSVTTATKQAVSVVIGTINIAFFVFAIVLFLREVKRGYYEEDKVQEASKEEPNPGAALNLPDPGSSSSKPSPGLPPTTTSASQAAPQSPSPDTRKLLVQVSPASSSSYLSVPSSSSVMFHNNSNNNDIEMTEPKNVVLMMTEEKNGEGRSSRKSRRHRRRRSRSPAVPDSESPARDESPGHEEDGI
eukprot:TRINITY_DN7029_c0_g2_i2.p1 TRINITY_DN7029_c0_g2~~TRINITY_DN7029_c0_g2_i2.p1  ORF type:complete len:453 (+),score=112.27 TRINITY_DN7029_c0_g2_i2:713-2071(+)